MTAISLIDTHIHLDDARFDDDREAVIARAAAQGIKNMVVPATTRRSWKKIQSITSTYPTVHPAYGLHPLFIEEHSQLHLHELEAWGNQPRCIAIGECGLDRYCLRKLPPSTANNGEDSIRHQTGDTAALFNRQIFYFEAQLSIAAKLDLPVIVHALQAVEAVILSIKKIAATRGVIHSFNGSQQQAHQLIELGYLLSFGGAATYPRARKIRSLIASLPAESILIETDAPDQTGYRQQGCRNEPAFLPEILQTVAELRGESPESMAFQCNRNAQNLFGLDGY